MEIRKLRITYVMLVISASVFIYFAFSVKSSKPLKFDHAVSSFLKSLFTEWSYPLFKLFNVLGSTIGIGIISLIIVAVLWLTKRDYLRMSFFTFTIVLGSLFNSWIKKWIGRPRPETEHLVHVKSLSFPSGHAMMNTILFMLIVYFIISMLHSRGIKWVFYIFVFLFILTMGVSRIVLNVHYPSDVAAGFALGIVWVIIWLILYESFRKKSM